MAALFGVRGGYGSAQILPLLDRDEARRACKPFIGYSDLTSLLTFLTLGCGLIAFHGPMLAGRLGRVVLAALLFSVLGIGWISLTWKREKQQDIDNGGTS